MLWQYLRECTVFFLAMQLTVYDDDDVLVDDRVINDVDSPKTVPPPPPPPLPTPAGAPRRQALGRTLSRAKMRTLAWSKLPASRVAKQRSVWSTSKPTENSDDLDFDEMERLFTVTTAPSTGTSINNSASSTERKKTNDEVRAVLLVIM